MTNRFFIISFCVLIPLLGCSRFNPTDSSIQTDTTHTAIIMVDDLSSAGLATDNAQIKSAVISSDVLTVIAQYGGGCKQHDFKLFGSRRFLESYPVQADVVLSHNANGDACKALISDSLRFSLQRLKETFQMYYGGRGTILLRLHEPGKQEPLLPLIRYEF
ncbi:MAG: hypothetical protein HW389_3280 [Bacteroidetes bacterium]|nr:hypothetical protein [Bacteroidota bacterium]